MFDVAPFAGAPTADAVASSQEAGDVVRYSARFDGYFDVAADRWLEPPCTCGDPDCPSTGRPERPSDCTPFDLDDIG